jgi:HPt (histidine-containing phosphotransfer) domain-containing protein
MAAAAPPADAVKCGLDNGVNTGVSTGAPAADSPADSPADSAADCPADVPADLPPAQRAAFLQLQRRFQSGLAARQSAIAGAASAAELQTALHRLAGAAGGYGFTALGAAARAAEHCAATGDAPGLAAALQALHGLLDAAQVTVR